MEDGAEIEQVKSHGYEDKSAHKTAIHRAKAATDKEHRMSLWIGIKTYPKAIGWSMIISLCIAMEAFDLCLLNTFCTELPRTNSRLPSNAEQTACPSSKNSLESCNPMAAIRSLLHGRQDSEMADKQLNSLG